MPRDVDGTILALAAALVAASLIVLFWTVEPASPSLPPQNYDVYWEDPCIDALRAAMAQMEPFLIINPRWEDGYWRGSIQLTDDGMDQLQAAWQNWKETKLQCWRSS